MPSPASGTIVRTAKPRGDTLAPLPLTRWSQFAGTLAVGRSCSGGGDVRLRPLRWETSLPVSELRHRASKAWISRSLSEWSTGSAPERPATNRGVPWARARRSTAREASRKVSLGYDRYDHSITLIVLPTMLINDRRIQIGEGGR